MKELTTEEKEAVLKFNRQYKKDAQLILTGNLYRLKNPFEDNCFAELVVSEDKSEAYFVYVHGLSDVNYYLNTTVKLLGLEPNAKYYITEKDETVYGETLLNVGITIPLERGDYVGVVYHIKRCE